MNILIDQQLVSGNFYNGIPLSADVIITPGSAFFNGFPLKSDGICISKVGGFDDAPERDIVSSDVPRGHGRTILGDYWRKRTMKLIGTLIADDWASMDALIRDIKKHLAPREKMLQYLWGPGDVAREVKCTWIRSDSAFPDRDHFNIGHTEFELTFETYENPFLMELGFDTKGIFSETRLSISESINNLSTVQSSDDPTESDGVPSGLIFVFNVATDIDQVIFHNTTTGRKIRVPVSMTSGDVLEIDGETESVLLNQVPVDFLGRFDQMHPGVNTFDIIFSGDGTPSLNYDLTLKYRVSVL